MCVYQCLLCRFIRGYKTLQVFFSFFLARVSFLRPGQNIVPLQESIFWVAFMKLQFHAKPSDQPTGPKYVLHWKYGIRFLNFEMKLQVYCNVCTESVLLSKLAKSLSHCRLSCFALRANLK